MDVRCVWEHNGDDSLIYALDPVGAYARGESKEVALGKMKHEVISFLKWRKAAIPKTISVEIVEEKCSELNIADADSDVIFKDETLPLTIGEYGILKQYVLKSAEDFWELYLSIPDVDIVSSPNRTTFYGKVPQTAREVYEHTKNVNSYYFGEIGIEVDNEGTICECRRRGFEALEKTDRFLLSPAVEGSYGEMWSLRKVLRRFLWHDRIHAKAMCRMIQKTFGTIECNPFMFEL